MPSDEPEQRDLLVSDGTDSPLADSITRHLPGFLYRCRPDPPWTMQYLSENVVEITGHSSETFLNDPSVTYEQLIHEEDRSFVHEQIQKALQDERFFRIEYRLIDRYGSQRWVEQQGEGIRSEEEATLQGYIHDITDQKQLHLEDRLIRQAAEYITQSGDFETIITDILRVICSTCKWEYGEIWFPQLVDSMTLTAQVHYNPDNGDLEAFWEDNRTVTLQRGEGLVGRVWETGETEWAESSLGGRNFLDSDQAHQAGLRTALSIPCKSDGETVAVLVFYRKKQDRGSLMVDLMETVGRQLGPLLREKQLENQLKEQEVFYQSLFADSPAAIFVSDRSEIKARLDELQTQGVEDLETYLLNHPETLKEWIDSIRLRDVNQSALDILEVDSREQILSTSPQRFVRSETYEAFARELAALYSGESTHQDERPFWTTTGEKRILLTRTSIAEDFHGDWSQVYFSFTDITEQKQLQKRLQDTLNERTTLLQEVHHRVKNNLQVIVNLIRLQVREMDPNPEVESLMTNIQNRIFSMALIHDRVFEQSSFEDINIEDYLTELVNHIVDSQASPDLDLQLELDFDPVSLTVDTLIPCGIIINELVSNALLHGLENQSSGVMRVEFHELPDGSYQFSVEDNGVGWQGGVAFEETSSLGTTLVRNLAREQLHGTVEHVETESGVTLKVRFESETAPDSPKST